ncbi:hypothetical protein J2W56_004229 [Nocardia kruczakiae]|uniref:Uncharacterized protein n=1 Tax=Nocardia kruczakiae TaxID=261477 RepID=A0ABU1XIV3_9NOCA|nr:hypothetical protein [Nocardia kruczakiae]
MHTPLMPRSTAHRNVVDLHCCPAGTAFAASGNQFWPRGVVPDMTTPQPQSEVAERWTQARMRNLLARTYGRPQIARRNRLRAQRSRDLTGLVGCPRRG